MSLSPGPRTGVTSVVWGSKNERYLCEFDPKFIKRSYCWAMTDGFSP